MPKILQGPGGWAAGGGGQTQTVKAIVSSAEVLACYTTPQLLIPAPPAGQMIYPISVVYNIAGTADYTVHAGGSTGLWYGLPSVGLYADQMPYQGIGTLFHNSLWVSAPIFPTAPFEDGDPTKILATGIYFGATAGNPTVGDGSITITIGYHVIIP